MRSTKSHIQWVFEIGWLDGLIFIHLAPKANPIVSLVNSFSAVGATTLTAKNNRHRQDIHKAKGPLLRAFCSFYFQA